MRPLTVDFARRVHATAILLRGVLGWDPNLSIWVTAGIVGLYTISGGLTAVVITFGVTALLLAFGYRSWQITGDDRVEDDLEDRLVELRREQPVENEPTDSAGQEDDA